MTTKRSKGLNKYYNTLYVDGKQVRVHVHRAEMALGKPLPANAVVHHADGTRDNDAPLVICQDHSYHRLLHMRMKIRDAGGDPDTDYVCGHCRFVKPRTAFRSDSTRHLFGIYPWCSECSREAQRKQYRARQNRLAEAGS